MPTQAPHRPVRAELPHTVPQITDSLSRCAIRWHLVKRRSRFRVLGLLPSNGSVIRHPSFLGGVPRRGSPASSVLSRCYDSPESIPPRFVSFAWRYRGCARRFAPTGYGRPRLWAWTIGHPEPSRDCTTEISGFSQVPGRTPLCTCPGRVPRGTLDARPLTAPRMLPSARPKTSAPRLRLSRLVTTACTLAVYASRHGVTPMPARLASGGWPTLAG